MSLRYALPLALCLALTGCPYGSPVPLDEPQEAVLDPGLAGYWIITAAGGKGFSMVEIVPFNEHEYYVEMRTHEPEKPLELERYRVFSSQVGRRAFLNIVALRERTERGSFLLAAYEFKGGDTVVCSFVRDEAMKAAGELKTAKALRRYVGKRMADKDLFEEGFTLRRFTLPADPAKK